MALTAAERKRRQRQRQKALDIQVYQMELTEVERHQVAKGASRRGYEDQTEYLLALVAADLEKPADVACTYPDCRCPFDKPADGKCYQGFEEEGEPRITSDPEAIRNAIDADIEAEAKQRVAEAV